MHKKFLFGLIVCLMIVAVAVLWLLSALGFARDPAALALSLKLSAAADASSV